jgi:hypothetical protein
LLSGSSSPGRQAPASPSARDIGDATDGFVLPLGAEVTRVKASAIQRINYCPEKTSRVSSKDAFSTLNGEHWRLSQTYEGSVKHALQLRAMRRDQY